MDDFKLYAKNERGLESLVRTVKMAVLHWNSAQSAELHQENKKIDENA